MNARIYLNSVDGGPILDCEPFLRVLAQGDVGNDLSSSVFMQSGTFGAVGFLFQIGQGSVEREDYIGLIQGRTSADALCCFVRHDNGCSDRIYGDS